MITDKEKTFLEKDMAERMWLDYESCVRSLCKFKLKSLPDHIEDCIQSVFLDLIVELSKGNIIKYPKAWLLKVANNKIKDIYSESQKKSKRIVSLESNSADGLYCADVFDEIFNIDDEKMLIYKEMVINSLDINEQRLLVDRYNLKKSVSQIAKEYNTTENNIYQKLFRLRTKTKMLIEKVLEK